MLPVGLPADVRSCASTPKHRFATCADPFGSPWLRKSCRFPLRPRRRRVHSGRAVGRRLRGEPVVVFRWTVDRRSLVASVGADPPARQRRMRRDCAFSLAAVEQPDVADRPTNPPADRSWCTVGPLVGFAFGLVSPATSFNGSDGAPARITGHGACRRPPAHVLSCAGIGRLGPVLPGFAVVVVPCRCGTPSTAANSPEGRMAARGG